MNRIFYITIFLMLLLQGCYYENVAFLKSTNFSRIEISQNQILFKGMIDNQGDLYVEGIRKAEFTFRLDSENDKSYPYLSYPLSEDDMINICNAKWEVLEEKRLGKVEVEIGEIIYISVDFDHNLGDEDWEIDFFTGNLEYYERGGWF